MEKTKEQIRKEKASAYQRAWRNRMTPEQRRAEYLLNKKWKENNKDKMRESNKKYRNKPGIKEAEATYAKWYRETHAEEIRVYQRWYNKENRHIRKEIETRYKMKHPEKKLAHQAVRYMEKAEVCVKCGSNEQLEKHHPDYTKPKEFVTLCKKCHTKLHVMMKELGVSI